MASRLFILLLILMLFPEEEAWRRRRRRRWNPPPPQDCTVSGWSTWSLCSQNCRIGTQSRTRTVLTAESWGGSCPPYHPSEHQSCGLINGGCDQICHNGKCSCQVPGYTQSGNKCYDINECAPNGGKGPCSHICKNTVGWYNCKCPAGYYLSTSDPHQCLAYDCGDPATLFNACPSDSYSDRISSVCAKVTASCLQGTTYNEPCSLTCPQNYALAKIVAQPNKKFGEEYSSVDFPSVISTITCQKTQAGETSNIWDVFDNELGNYYCRRTNIGKWRTGLPDVNEAPSEIALSATSVRENEPDAVVGKVTVSDPDHGQHHQCTVHDFTGDVGSSTGTPSQFFTVDASLNLKTLHGLNFEAQHSLDIVINCSDVVANSLFKTQLFTILVKDVNEIPSDLCSEPILIGLKTSIGAVIAVLHGEDPDNENAIHNDPSNHSVVVKNKQQLTYSLSPEQNSWPFGIKNNSLFKSGAISHSQNFTLGVQVKDNGIIVASFSSKGYQYAMSKSLSAVLNCTIVVLEHHQSLEILLEPSHVSVKADNGTVVGVLTTVTQNSGETFTYKLLDEAQLPFSVDGNKLVVAKKDGLDFQVSSSEEALIPISIISKGNMSEPIRESFYVRVICELCERKPSLCGNCVGETLCVTFVEAAVRCLETQYQIPVLVSETGISSTRSTALEKEIGATLDGKRNDGNKSTARKRRAHSNFFYVEILGINQLGTQKHSLLILTALDARHKYFPLHASEACAMLANTERQCVESCEMLKLVGLPCGRSEPYKNTGAPKKGLGTGGVAGTTVVVIVVVIVLLIAVLVGGIVYYKWKHNHKPSEPLYQEYIRCKLQSEINLSRSDTSLNDEASLEESTRGTQGNMRKLWYELPEVRQSGILETMTSNERKRQEAMFEVITSEESYIRSLNFLMSHFINSDDLSPDSSLCVLERSQSLELFSNISDIKSVSERFLKALRARQIEAVEMSSISDIVLEHATTYFDVYMKHCSSKIYQDRALENLRKSERFLDAVTKLESNKKAQGLTLQSFLVLPMQRITRFPLLVNAICERCEADSDEYIKTYQALAAITKIANDCNEGLRKMERKEELCVLQTQIEFKTKPFALATPSRPSRYLLRRGDLMHVVEDSRNPSKRLRTKFKPIYMFLFNDLLLLVKKKSENRFVVLDYATRYNMTQVDEPQECDVSIGQHMFYLVLENSESENKKYLMAVNSKTDKTRWMEAFKPPAAEQEGETVYASRDCPQVNALYNYSAQQPDELSLYEGDVINVLKKLPDGWYHGERLCDGTQGWFPANHTEEILNEHVRARNKRQRYNLMRSRVKV